MREPVARRMRRGIEVGRYYRLPNGYTLSAANTDALELPASQHPARFVWEFALIDPQNNLTDGVPGSPLPSDVQRVYNADAYDAFVEAVFAWAEGGTSQSD